MLIPLPPKTTGKSGVLIFPDGFRRRFTITGEIRKRQSTNPNKVIIRQRIEFEDGRRQVRLGYYIIGKKPKMKGRWVWGQYAAMMPMGDFRKVIRRAERSGWF
jgi:hypothetical protein